MTTINFSAIASDRIKEIEPKDIPDNAFIVDIRTPAEYKAISLEREHNFTEMSKINPKEFVQQYGLKDKEIYILCNSGNRATKSAKMFQAAGFDNITVVKGGIQRAKEQIATKVGEAIPLERQIRIAAGLLVLIGLFLAVFASKYFLIVPLFVGAGLVYSGITGDCYMGMVLADMPWNR